MLTDDELREIEERCQKADAGPWYVVGPPWLDSDYPPWVISGNPDPHLGQLVCDVPIEDVPDEDEAFAWASVNMQFIAASREDIPKLLHTIKVLNKSLQNICFQLSLMESFNPFNLNAVEPEYWIAQAEEELK